MAGKHFNLTKEREYLRKGHDFMSNLSIIAITFIAVCVLGSMDNSTVVVADFLAVVVVTFLIPGVLLHVH